jgi:hypothetical protein
MLVIECRRTTKCRPLGGQDPIESGETPVVGRRDFLKGTLAAGIVGGVESEAKESDEPGAQSATTHFSFRNSSPNSMPRLNHCYTSRGHILRFL